MHVRHAVTGGLGERGDELLPGEDAFDVGIVEDVVDARQTERGAGDHDRLGIETTTCGAVRCPRWRWRRHVDDRRRCCAVDPQTFLDHAREQLSELHDAVIGNGVAARRCDRGRRRLGDRDRCRLVEADAGRPEPTQRLVDRRGVAQLGVVGVEREHIVVPAEDVLDEPVQRSLRTDLDEHAASASYKVCNPCTNCTGDATWRPR